MNKKASRLRRAKKSRAKIQKLLIPRLTVFRTSKHIYAQIIDQSGDRVLVSASTSGKDLKTDIAYGGNISAAIAVGNSIAQKAKDKGIERVAFDRSGFKYHGRVKALADSARENGLKF